MTPAGLNQPVDDGLGNKIVKPTDNTLHQSYLFFIKATATNGGSNGFFGPYTLHVGCTAATVSFSDSGSNVIAQRHYVSNNLVDKFRFWHPTSSRVWCSIITSVILNSDGTAWSGSNNLIPNTISPIDQYFSLQTALMP